MRYLISSIILYLIIALILFIIVIFSYKVIKSIQWTKKSGIDEHLAEISIEEKKYQKKFKTIAICSFLFFIFGFIANLGLLRAFLFIPIVLHTIIFYRVSSTYRRISTDSFKKKEMLSMLGYISFAGGYVFLPDLVSDTANSASAFLGFIDNENIISIMFLISKMLILLNLLTLILQYKSVIIAREELLKR